jgi:hypothetical protein
VEDEAAVLLAATCVGCTGAAASGGTKGPGDGGSGDHSLGDGGAGACSGAATGPCIGIVPCTACGGAGSRTAGPIGGVPTHTRRAPVGGAVRSCSSIKKSRAEGAMDVVDMSEKGRKDS